MRRVICSLVGTDMLIVSTLFRVMGLARTSAGSMNCRSRLCKMVFSLVRSHLRKRGNASCCVGWTRVVLSHNQNLYM